MNDSSQNILLLLILALVALFSKILLPKIKGLYGETKISILLKLLPSKKYKIINDVLITTDNRSSQIDHIIVSNYGIFVIETKHYKGWIFGHEKSNNWTQTLYNNKYKFRNPIIQCWGHVKTLKNVLNEYDGIEYIPIVAFTGDAKLKGITSSIPVIYTFELLNCIKDFDEYECLNEKEVDLIQEKLNQLNQKDRKSRKAHIAKAKSHYNLKSNVKTCPRCGGNLILKNGKFGEFYGCEEFPYCKYTKNI